MTIRIVTNQVTKCISKIKYIWLYCLLFTTMNSCISDKLMDDIDDSKTKTIDVSPNESMDTILYSSFVKNIRYIPIETNDTFLIGKIDKLIVSDSAFFILDRSITKSVYCIDKNGKIKFCINRLGIGPNEYIDINDIDFNDNKKELLIYTTNTNSIMLFNKDGYYKQTRKIAHKGLALASINSNLFTLYRSYLPFENHKEIKSANLLICSEKDIISEGCFFDNKIRTSVTWTSFPQFSRFDDTLGIKPDHNDIVYHIYDNVIKPVYRFDFGKSQINHKYWEVAMSDIMSSKKMNEYVVKEGICESYNYLESNEYIYLNYYYMNNKNHLLYSKRTNKLLHFRKAINNLNLLFTFNPIAIKENKLYSVMRPEKLSLTLINYTLMRRGHLFNEFEFSDNPIIVEFTLNSF